jgi:hypothetical protein
MLCCQHSTSANGRTLVSQLLPLGHGATLEHLPRMFASGASSIIVGDPDAEGIRRLTRHDDGNKGCEDNAVEEGTVLARTALYELTTDCNYADILKCQWDRWVESRLSYEMAAELRGDAGGRPSVRRKDQV